MRPGEPLADTNSPDKPLRTLGDWIYTPSGLIALYLGETKRRKHAWAVNILDFLLRIFVIYITEMVTTIPDLTGLSPLFLGKYSPRKRRYQQISRRQHRAFIRGKLMQLGICQDEEEALRYSSYSTRPGLVEGLEDLGIPRYVVAMFTRHASDSIIHYERPSSQRLLERLQKAYAIARTAGAECSTKQRLTDLVDEHYKRCEVSKLERTCGLLTSPRMNLTSGIRPFLDMTPGQTEKIRKSASGALQDMAFDKHSLSAFLVVMQKLPHKAGFFADHGMPVHYDLVLKGSHLGKLRVKGLTRAAKAQWNAENPTFNGNLPVLFSADMARLRIDHIFRTTSGVLKPGVQPTPLLTARRLYDTLGSRQPRHQSLITTAPNPLAWQRAIDPLGLNSKPASSPRSSRHRHKPSTRRRRLHGRRLPKNTPHAQPEKVHLDRSHTSSRTSSQNWRPLKQPTREVSPCTPRRVHSTPHRRHDRHPCAKDAEHPPGLGNASQLIPHWDLDEDSSPEDAQSIPQQRISLPDVWGMPHWSPPRDSSTSPEPSPERLPTPYRNCTPTVTPAGTPPLHSHPLSWGIMEPPPFCLRENEDPRDIPGPQAGEQEPSDSDSPALCLNGRTSRALHPQG